jgi:1,4-alpha-glucan branching enzyme
MVRHPGAGVPDHRPMIRKRTKGDATIVTFAVPDAGHPVSVVADFNGWNPYAHPLKRRSNGTRSVAVELPAGTVARFRYLSGDGRFFDDPDGDGWEPNGFGDTHTLVVA